MRSAMLRSVERVLGTGLVLFVAIISNASICAADVESKFLYFGVEIPKLDFFETENDIEISNISEEIRTIPSHPDDPYTAISPLPNGTFHHSPSFHVIDYVRAKCMLWDVIGAGVRVAGSGIDEGDETGAVRLFDEEHFVGDYYNYATHYSSSWGDAYVLYQTYYETDIPSFGFFVEGKTPSVNVTKGLAVSLFGGYEPDVVHIRLKAMNGWDRWNSMEVRNEYDLAEVTMSRAYVGLEVSFPGGKNNGLEVGVRLYHSWNLFEVEGPIEFSTETSTMWGGSLIIKF